MIIVAGSGKSSFYVALGSSYAAGPGLGPRVPGSPFISQRTIGSYPELLARLLDVPTFRNVRSSGSTVRQVLQGGQFYLGPQVDALGAATRLVTLTAGGNDVRYIGDMTSMAYRNRGGLIGAALDLFRKDIKSAEQRDFDRLASDLRATLLEIKRRSAHARTVVVTYPQLLPPVGSCVDVGLTEDQVKLMRSVGERLARVTREVATGEGATVVDMASLSSGHHACSKEPWINGFKPNKAGSFHPNEAGAKATALAVANVVRGRVQ
ncbi:SGNH/GDSL hydrolase family protein [Rhizobium sp. 16-449-1b]|uniref:SGNH/GDSL hydrolase family protein n=1 Tax=Rhizobium sp. 16-449-1b TaxID=2819989 RepID=UPI001FFDF250|nr:SGNH/GDSL hydrolase family protein [Rhizobium sp. 16-449-1b]